MGLKGLLAAVLSFLFERRVAAFTSLGTMSLFGDSTRAQLFMSTSANRDFYELLDIPRTASVTEIKVVYRKLAKTYHPDANTHEDTTQLFQEINRAYEVLSNPHLKKQYDLYGQDGIGTSAASDSPTAAEQQADTRARKPPSQEPVAGQDLRFDVVIDANMGMIGGEKSVQIKYPQTCLSCHGESNEANRCGTCGGTGVTENIKQVRLRIPRGVQSGNLLRVHGEGIPGTNGGPAGNLYIFINIGGVFSSHRISYADAVVGNFFWLQPDFEQFSSNDYIW